MRRSLPDVFAIPALLGALSLVGLISALLADGFGDLLSWLTLGLPVAAVAFFWLRPVRRPD